MVLNNILGMFSSNMMHTREEILPHKQTQRTPKLQAKQVLKSTNKQENFISALSIFFLFLYLIKKQQKVGQEGFYSITIFYLPDELNRGLILGTFFLPSFITKGFDIKNSENDSNMLLMSWIKMDNVKCNYRHEHALPTINNEAFG